MWKMRRVEWVRLTIVLLLLFLLTWGGSFNVDHLCMCQQSEMWFASLSVCVRQSVGKIPGFQSGGPILKSFSRLPAASLWWAAGEWAAELAVSSCSCSSSWNQGRRSVTCDLECGLSYWWCLLAGN